MDDEILVVVPDLIGDELFESDVLLMLLGLEIDEDEALEPLDTDEEEALEPLDTDGVEEYDDERLPEYDDPE